MTMGPHDFIRRDFGQTTRLSVPMNTRTRLANAENAINTLVNNIMGLLLVLEEKGIITQEQHIAAVKDVTELRRKGMSLSEGRALRRAKLIMPEDAR